MKLERFEVFYLVVTSKNGRVRKEVRQDLFSVDNQETWCSAPVFRALAAGYEGTSPDDIEIHGWTKVDGP